MPAVAVCYLFQVTAARARAGASAGLLPWFLRYTPLSNTGTNNTGNAGNTGHADRGAQKTGISH